MASTEFISYILLEEALNTLLADKTIQSRRYGQVNMVREKLLLRVRNSLATEGLTEEVRQSWLQGEPQAQTFVAGLLPRLLSQRMQRQFRFLVSEKKPHLALPFLEECLLDKEQVRFRKESGLSPKVWSGFYRSTAVSSPETLKIIKTALAMNEAECRRFDALEIREVFPAGTRLKRQVHRHRKDTGMAILEFLNYAYVGKDAWEAFYPIPPESGEEEGDPRNTRQDTLLKLIIGFGLEESSARELLALADSDFIVLRDLVFLACIRTGYRNPGLLPDILDYFAEGPDGEPLFFNPYSRMI